MNDTSRDAQDSGAFDDEVVVIGSGFGGSVAALRLVEKGYRVRVYEAGRRFEDEDFPKTNWNVRRYLWAPKLGCFGIQRIHRLPHVMILAGAGVGGGSLNYANTLYQPGGALSAETVANEFAVRLTEGIAAKPTPKKADKPPRRSRTSQGGTG